MSYITEGEVKEAISNNILNQIAIDEGLSVSQLIAAAINAADSIIDGKLNKITSVPLTSPPGIIKEIAKKIVKHWLYSRTHDIPDDMQRDFLWADTQLNLFMSGEMTLETSATAAPGVTIVNNYEDSPFPKGFLK